MVVCFLIKLGRLVSNEERMDPIHFGGQRSKVKVTMDMFGHVWKLACEHDRD